MGRIWTYWSLHGGAALLGFGAAPALAAEPARTDWRLTVDMSVFADSNITNSTDDAVIPVYPDGGAALPVPLDPSLRARGGIGFRAAANGGVRIPVADGVKLVVDAEIFAVDYGGSANDDVALLGAAGAEIEGEDARASVQLTAFDRWYGGISVAGGYGVRAVYDHELRPGDRLLLSVDARVFRSEYGEDFGGTGAAASLVYQSVLGEGLSGSAGIYVRRDWLGSDAYSSLEVGAYGGLSRFLGPDLTGSIAVGLSRLTFDAPLLYLSPQAREDWRAYGTVSLAARKPIGRGLYPSLGYTYNRTRSSTSFFRAERHRLRLGLLRQF